MISIIQKGCCAAMLLGPSLVAASEEGDSGLAVQPVVLEQASAVDLSIEPTSFETTTESVVECDDDSCDAADESIVSFDDWVGYNAAQSDTTWLVDSDFGMFSLESFPTLKFGKESAILFGTGFHFLNGPAGSSASSPDMPPRLFDLQMAFHTRSSYGSGSILDVKLGLGLFTDFEGSSRKGLRFPGHVVAYNELTPDFIAVMGVDVLDRDDISALPVAGFVWKAHRELMFECVFPRPRVRLQLDPENAMYFGGELGGGTWAIQRDDTTNDNVTYRDLRVMWGIESYGEEAETTLEIGWAFDRSLEYRSGNGETDFEGALLLRWHTHF